jgi:hypothetical protein
MKPKLAPKMAAMAGITGSTWTAPEMAMAIGTTMAALMMVIETRLETFRVLARPSPRVLARPVSYIREPRAMPAPKSRMVPQSIRDAWFQLRVNWRRPPRPAAPRDG